MSRTPYQSEYDGQDGYDGYDYNLNMQQLSLHDQPIFQPFIPYTGQSAFQYPYYDPYYGFNQASPINSQVPFPPWNPPASPNPGLYRMRNSLPGPSAGRTSNRMSWSGPDKARERKAYHPQPPVNRSDWVMWVGNVPPNTTHEELWKFFNSRMGTQPWRGPSSIFLISRSSCAFVNLTSEEDLARAVEYFHGKPLRPWDPRCPKLVCRVRRKDDDLRSGVGAQRGTGMHRDWVKKQEPVNQAQPPEGEGRRRESIVEGAKLGSSASCASTNSSFLTQNFPMRCFILKSTSILELEQSVKIGVWKTQRHNEPVLDQAFRTAQEVYLVFGANKTGEFFGYAKMVELIDKEKAKKYSSGSSKKIPPVEDDTRPRGGSEPPRPTYFLLPSQSRVTSTSPGEITPADECQISVEPRSNTDPAKPNVYADDNPRPKQKGLPAEEVSPLEKVSDPDGVVRKDTLIKEDGREEDGHSFRVQWIKVGRLSFNQTRHLRNPWNADREVKVSRDGTELEPGVASSLMQLWDK